jgi:hypothetical protein
MKCQKCGKELCSSDYGLYCDNENCPNYDIVILKYEKGND